MVLRGQLPSSNPPPFPSCSSDNTVTIFENAKDSRSMFKFNSFRFQRFEKVSTVWLHCEITVCDGERLVCTPVRNPRCSEPPLLRNPAAQNPRCSEP